MECSNTNIAFLYTMVYVKDNTLKTTLYKKNTNNKKFLHFSSEHPPHIKRSITFAQAIRYRRIVQDNNKFNIEINNLKYKYLTRNYPNNILDTAIDRVNTLNRSDLLTYKIKSTTPFNSTPLIITYCNALISNWLITFTGL